MGEIQRDKIDLSLTTEEKRKRLCIVLTCKDNKNGACHADEVCTWLSQS